MQGDFRSLTDSAADAGLFSEVGLVFPSINRTGEVKRAKMCLGGEARATRALEDFCPPWKASKKSSSKSGKESSNMLILARRRRNKKGQSRIRGSKKGEKRGTK